ncbi:unnamed protein product [Caretta caretta]
MPLPGAGQSRAAPAQSSCQGLVPASQRLPAIQHPRSEGRCRRRRDWLLRNECSIRLDLLLPGSLDKEGVWKSLGRGLEEQPKG